LLGISELEKEELKKNAAGGKNANKSI